MADVQLSTLAVMLDRSSTVNTGAVTTNSPILSLLQEWNGAVTFRGAKINITDTASNSDSILFDIQKDSSSLFAFNADGSFEFGSGAKVSSSASDKIETTGVSLYPYGVYANNAGTIGWSDCALYRDDADVFGLRRSTSSQTLRIYNTYTDASNYERLSITWDTNVLNIDPTQSSGTGTARTGKLIGTWDADGITPTLIGGSPYLTSLLDVNNQSLNNCGIVTFHTSNAGPLIQRTQASSDTATLPIGVVGQAAYGSAAVNLDGGDIELDGGAKTGAGDDGNIVLGSTRGYVGIKNTNPSEALDVTGNIAVSGTVDGRDIATDGSKLDTIESSSTADQTGAEIEGLLDTKLANTDWKKAVGTGVGTVAAGDHVHEGTEIKATGVTDGYVLAADGADGVAWEAVAAGAAQLSDLTDVNTSTPTAKNLLVADGIDWESRALVSTDISDSTADGRTLLTSADANPFTDADETKLDGVEAGSTADQTGAEIESALDIELANTDWKKAVGTGAGTVAAGDHDHSGVYEPAGVAAADITDSTADGRTLLTSADANPFTDADETKLDGIEAGADVTDTANVTSAGALMDSEVTSLSGVKTLTVPDSTTISAFMTGVLDDTTAAAARSTLGVAYVLTIACSDEDTDLVADTAVVTFYMPFAMTVTDVRASVTTAPVTGSVQVDINEEGSSILSTVISIDSTEFSSEDAGTQPVISDSTIADDAKMTIDIDAVGSGTAGTGLKVYIIGTLT